jgi:hypothetical protein
MWVPNEPILYVGRASTSIADRVNAYYRTRLGARAPHAGGWPLKTLSNLDGLSVHVAPTDDPAAAETAMIDAFVAGVPKPTSDLLVDPALPLPFANLEDGRGRRKAHGIRGARAPYARKAADREMASPARIKAHALQERSVIDGVVLNVTAKDLEKGQIRITRPAKALLDLPERASEVRVYLRGQTLIASWDARLGPDKERSGLFRVGREKLKAVLGSDSMQLTMRIDRDGAIHLD